MKIEFSNFYQHANSDIGIHAGAFRDSSTTVFSNVIIEGLAVNMSFLARLTNNPVRGTYGPGDDLTAEEMIGSGLFDSLSDEERFAVGPSLRFLIRIGAIPSAILVAQEIL